MSAPGGVVVASVAIMGALGALSRWGVGLLVQRMVPTDFPLGTLAANATGCLLLGVVTGLSTDALPPHLRVPLATGFLGSFTTFSTFSVESIQLMEKGGTWLLAANVGASVVLGLLGAGIGLQVGRSGG